MAQPSPLSADVLRDFHNIPSLVAEIQQLAIEHDQQLQALHDVHKENTAQLIADHKTAIQTLTDKSTALTQQIVSRATDTLQRLAQKGEEIKFVQKGDPGEPGLTPQAGIHYYTEAEKKALLEELSKLLQHGKDGLSADPQTVADLILEKGLIKVEHIAGLDEKIATVRRAAALGGMRGGGDSVAAGTGISVAYNSTTGKVTITNTGTASNKVRDETPAGSGTSFTLAHTPVANTLQLFRGGARQQVGAGKDYTVSGTTITLAQTLISGEILLADYEY